MKKPKPLLPNWRNNLVKILEVFYEDDGNFNIEEELKDFISTLLLEQRFDLAIKFRKKYGKNT